MGNNQFCPACGTATQWIVPEGDDRYRAVCASCNTVHYENPKLVVGCIVAQEEKILLCRRAIEPQKGKWTVPAGYLKIMRPQLRAPYGKRWKKAVPR